MQAAEAAHVVNKMIFRPGWHFTAFRDYRPGTIVVDIECDTQDTNYPPNYEHNIRTGPGPFTLDVSRMSKDDLFYAVYQVIDRINQHEDCEFLRDGTELDREGMPRAPFHPHHPDGIRNWEYYNSFGERLVA